MVVLKIRDQVSLRSVQSESMLRLQRLVRHLLAVLCPSVATATFSSYYLKRKYILINSLE